MKFSDLIVKLLSTVAYVSKEESFHSLKSWLSIDSYLSVISADKYREALEEIYEYNELIANRFSRKTVYKAINDQVPSLKKLNDFSNIKFEDFFEELLSIKSRDLTITSPVSGIRLDDGVKEFSLSSYKFGYLEDLEYPITNEHGMYISVVIKNTYDSNIAIEKAQNAFLDFARLITFISGKLDRSIVISFGLPLMPSISHEFMYVSSSSYQISNEYGLVESSTTSNKDYEKVPINNSFFCSNPNFGKLWILNEQRINGPKLNDINSRLINSSLALGESALTTDKKNSILYTCMSLEIMFSYDERELFQRSIGEKLSSIFTFIVAKDKESRLETSKIVKEVYGMRSAIVHGGNKELTDENLAINFLMRAALSEILTKDKFQGVKNIGQIYEMLKEAQNSY